MPKSHDVLVVGAGPAGLATSRELTARAIDHLVVERGDRIGHTWANLYDGLVLHTGKHFSALPGLTFPAATPLFPTRHDFLEYLDRYARTFRVPVETGADVARIARTPQGWLLRTASGDEKRARAVVVATGILSNPHVPEIPNLSVFRGRIIHSVDYRRPDAFGGERVLVVGAGNSAAEISVELARAGARVTIAVRSGAHVVPRELFGVPIQYFAVALGGLPSPVRRVVTEATARISARVRGPAVLPPPAPASCSHVPVIGFELAEAVRAGAIRLIRGPIEFTARTVRFEDSSEERFDQVILATGYRAAVHLLGDLIQLDNCGFAARRNRVMSVDQPDLYFVGHNYDTQGGLRNIWRDAQLAAKTIARSLVN